MQKDIYYFDTTHINTIQHSDIELETGFSKAYSKILAEFINTEFPNSKFAVQNLEGTEFFHIKLTTVENEKVTITVGSPVFYPTMYSVKLHINDAWHCVKGHFVDADSKQNIMQKVLEGFNEKYKHYD